MGPWCSAGGLFFFKCSFSYSFWILSLQRVKLLLLQKLSVRPGTIRFPGAYYWPGIRFKTTAAILAAGQCLLSCNTCRGIQLLRWGNGDGSYWPGKLILAGVINRILLFTLAVEFWNRLLLLIVSKSEKSLLFCMNKGKFINFFVVKSDKSLLFCIEKWQILTFL